MRSLGDDQIAANPLAAHCAAWAAALSGEQESVRRWLPMLDTGHLERPLPDGMQSLKSSAALLRAVFGFDGIGPMREAGAMAVKLESDPTSPWYALARTAFGAALYYSGELDQAAAQAEEARLSHESISLVRMLTFAVMSLIAVEEGRLAQAEELAHTARDIVTDPELGLSTAPQSSLAYTAAGAVYARRGQLAEATSEFEHALRCRRRWVGISPWPTVEILLRLAPVLAELDDLPGATALLDEARQLLTWLPDGADAQLTRLARLDRQLAGQSRAGSLAEPLTERERAVLQLLRGPLSLREIGHELYLSLNTIKTHTRAIYRKLGVSDRQDAVAKGRELDLL